MSRSSRFTSRTADLGHRLRRLPILAASLIAASAGAANDQAGLTELKRLLTDQTAVNGVFVQRRLGYDGSETYVIKLEIARKFGTRFTILQPISSQGVTSIDDGKELRTYYPDTHSITIQPSAVSFSVGLNERMKLIQKNYDVTLGRPVTIAGRRANLVELEPRSAAMPTRLMAIDQKQNALLRYELVSRTGSKTRLVDTISVEYASSDRTSSFKFDAPRDTATERMWGPKPFKDLKFAAAAVGFEPRIPASLPYGFTIQGQQLVGQENAPFISIRVSDGMSMATIYQWDPSRFSGGPPQGLKGQHKDRFGIHFQVQGDAPRTVLAELGEQFARLR
mgnify:CR=1 FL=1